MLKLARPLVTPVVLSPRRHCARGDRQAVAPPYPPRRRSLIPIPTTNQSRLGTPSSPALSSNLSRRDLARVRRIPQPAVLEDHIARSQELPGALAQTEGMVVGF
jgi:hypothetical protein